MISKLVFSTVFSEVRRIIPSSAANLLFSLWSHGLKNTHCFYILWIASVMSPILSTDIVYKTKQFSSKDARPVIAFHLSKQLTHHAPVDKRQASSKRLLLVLCKYKFVSNLFIYNIYFFLIVRGSGQLNKAYLCFRLVCTNAK